MVLDVDYTQVSGLKLIAFDLDGTIWDPEMYQLWGGGAPFRVAPNKRDLLDSKGTVVHLLGVTAEILHDIKSIPELNTPKVAWVSCTDEPAWANECLGLFVTQPSNVPLDRIADASEIFDGNKQLHFKGLRETFPDIDFSEMLFFDNQMNNISSVSKLGVKCVYCPDGMTLDIWKKEDRIPMAETWKRDVASDRSSLTASIVDARWKLANMFDLTKLTWFINQYTGPVSPFEIVCALVMCVVPIIYVIVSSKTDSGKATEYVVFITVLMALRKNFLEYVLGVSWERAIMFHKLFGTVAFVCSCLHGLTQLSGMSSSEIMQDSKSLTGLVALCVLGAQPVMYIFVKPFSFELFYYTHLALYGVLVYFAIKHGALFVAWALIAFGVDLVLRFALYTYRAKATIQAVGGDMVQVTLDKKFAYRPTQYVFLMIPALGVHEFHPFSISSAPHEEHLTLHVSIQGNWSRKLSAMAVEAATKGVTLEPTVLVQGPCGTPSVNFEDGTYEIIVLISGGSGVTPHQSLANHLMECHARGRPLKKLVYVWAVPENRVALVTAMMQAGQLPQNKSVALLPSGKAEPQTLAESQEVLYTGIYCSGRRQREQSNYKEVVPAEAALENGTGPRLPPLHHGRPDFKELLEQVKSLALAQKERRVAVSVCGPNAMIANVVDACRTITSAEVRFDLHVERFQL